MKMKNIWNRIKYRFSIENISVNDVVVLFILCGYALFFLVDLAFPFKNLPLSFLLLSIILFALFLFSQFKTEVFEKPLIEAKKKKYEEKKIQAQNAYLRYLKQEQIKVNKEREAYKSKEQGYKEDRNNYGHEAKEKKNNQESNGASKSEKNKSTRAENKAFNRKEYKYYSDYGKYYEYKTDGKSSKNEDKYSSNNDGTSDKKSNGKFSSDGLEFVFFKNCTNAEQVEKTYKKLCQIYHPDQSTGNNEMFLIIKEEYELAKKKYS